MKSKKKLTNKNEVNEEKRKENKRQSQQQTAVAFYNHIDVRARGRTGSHTRWLGQLVHSHFIFPNIYF